MYSLCLLGKVTLDGPDGPIAGSATQPRQMALLALLASAGSQGRTRDKLTFYLGLKGTQQAARHSLADAVYRIRKALGPDAIQGRGQVLSLNRGLVRSDVDSFLEALARNDLESAADVYAGPFLDGFHLGGSAEFEHWRDSEAQTLSARMARALETLAEQADQNGDSRYAARWWSRACTVDPLNSRFTLRLMQSLARAGNPGNAVQIADAHVALLHEGLGAEAPPDLTDLLETLRSKGAAPEASSKVGAQDVDPGFPFSESLRSPPAEQAFTFVGRERELEYLDGLLDKRNRGSGRVVFLAGEAGTGKTAIAREFCERSMALHPDLVAAWGSCDVHTGAGDPYHPFREILTLLTGGIEAPWAAGALSTSHAKRLWRVWATTGKAIVEEGPDLMSAIVSLERVATRASEPGAHSTRELDQMIHAPDAPRPFPDGAPQRSLIGQYSGVLTCVAETHPLLLVLDDMQWADSGTMDLLFQLGRNLEGRRLLILALFRPSELSLGPSGRHPLEKLIHELEGRFGDLTLTLHEDDDRAFFEAMIDSEPNGLDWAFRDRLFRRTKGHALFTAECLREMKDAGALVRDIEGRWVQVGDIDWARRPARVEAVIGERIERLPARLQQLLSAASVEGESFTLEVLADLVGEDPVDIVSVVGRDLERRHALVVPKEVHRTSTGRISRYRFRHVLIQEYLYGRLDDAELAYLHEKAARSLETLLGDRVDMAALALARHFRDAGLLREAVSYLGVAAANAERAGAYNECVDLWQQARQLVSSLPGSATKDRLELDVLSSLILVWYATFIPADELVRILKRMIELSRALGDETALFWALGTRFASHHYRGEHDAGRAVLREVEPIAERSGDSGLMAQYHGWTGLNSLNRGEPAASVQHLDRFEAIYDPSRHRAVVGLWLKEPLPVFRALKAISLGPLGYPERAAEVLGEAWGMVDETTDGVTRLHVHLYDVLARWACRDVAEAQASDHAMQEYAPKIDASGFPFYSDFVRGWSLSEQGEVEEGIRVMMAAMEAVDAFGWTVWKPIQNATLADALRKVGRAEEGLELLDAGILTIEATGERGHESELHRIRAELLRALPEPDATAAESAFRRAIEIARAQEARLFELRASVGLARLLMDSGRAREVPGIVGPIYGWFTEGFEFPDLQAARAVIANLRQRRRSARSERSQTYR